MVARAVPPQLQSIPNAKTLDIPAVFLLAGRDTLVTPHYQQMVVDAYHGPKQLIHLPTYGLYIAAAIFWVGAIALIVSLARRWNRHRSEPPSACW